MNATMKPHDDRMRFLFLLHFGRTGGETRENKTKEQEDMGKYYIAS
ncbi:hypothetical protein [Ligaoa zhengdingensis]